jgi:beta-glucosidase
MNETIEARVELWLSRMNLAQKIGQMTQAERAFITPEQVRDFHIGSVLSGGGSAPGANRPADWVAMNDAYWAASVEEGPGLLPIPILYGIDAIHGNNNVLGATVFPHNIGLGAARDADLIRRVARVTAREILAAGVEWTFAPTLAVARDMRWGRVYESYAEEPDLVGRYGQAFIEGLQGDLGDGAVVACLKHWVGDGGTHLGVDQGDTLLSEAELRAVHIAPYLPALRAGALTVMASYNSWNGLKCHGHRRLLTDILKGELGFEGLVVSDWNGIDHLGDDPFDNAIQAVNAGVDLFMVPDGWPAFIAHVTRGVASGRVSMARIDDAVRRILRVKIAFGLFEMPRPAARAGSNSPTYGSPEHRTVAREAVRKSLVLLKHRGHVLPLQRTARVLVAGHAADDRGAQCGGFTVAWQGSRGNALIEGGTSIWEGLSAVAGAAVLDPTASTLDDGATYDVAVVVIGESPYAEGLGDIRPAGVVVPPGSGAPSTYGLGAANLKKADLHPYAASIVHAINRPEDLALIQRIAAAGIPVVTVFLSGRPVQADPEIDASAAFVAAWLPGSEGAGVADVLFGDAPFHGRLSFAWAGADGVRFPNGFGLGLGGPIDA